MSSGSDKDRSLSTLSFSYTFDYDKDCAYFAHFVPYTYTDLTHFLNTIPRSFPNHKEFMRGNVLCKTISGFKVPVLTITEKIRDYMLAPVESKLMEDNPLFYKHWKKKNEEVDKFQNQAPTTQLAQSAKKRR